MTQNMFQEGLYHVFFKDRTSGHPLTVTTNQEEFKDVRIGRWFGTVVNTRLLVTGVLQVFGALASILTTVTYACVSFNCSVSLTTPVWSGLFVTTLIGLNIFSLLLGCCALLAYSLITSQAKALYTDQQRAGVYIAKGSSIMFTVQCLLASVYTLFLSWRGLRRYSGPHTQTYNRLAQGPDEDTNEPLMETGEFSL
ncbi:transmembrane protein 253 isoform X2 [Oncorhynchus tshawytscha]|uniref:transmembrane protein 253 isoform X2 n=1 Tax=Oncorhynchus tshawytscha TaxID=74940 RepID=UPI000D09DF8F|nr:transmembrane protein 253 isoform X2 [Oncorhynchus tshawytscha]